MRDSPQERRSQAIRLGERRDVGGLTGEALAFGHAAELARDHAQNPVIVAAQGASAHDEQMTAMMNRHLNPDCETVFVLPSAGQVFISSRLVREIASLGGSVDGLVPATIAARLAARYRAEDQ